MQAKRLSPSSHEIPFVLTERLSLAARKRLSSISGILSDCLRLTSRLLAMTDPFLQSNCEYAQSFVDSVSEIVLYTDYEQIICFCLLVAIYLKDQ